MYMCSVADGLCGRCTVPTKSVEKLKSTHVKSLNESAPVKNRYMYYIMCERGSKFLQVKYNFRMF